MSRALTKNIETEMKEPLNSITLQIHITIIHPYFLLYLHDMQICILCLKSHSHLPTFLAIGMQFVYSN